jgi:hypothetical protein
MTLLSSLSVVASNPAEHRIHGIGMMRQKLLGRIEERNITFLVLYRLSAALRCDVAKLTGNMPPHM